MNFHVKDDGNYFSLKNLLLIPSFIFCCDTGWLRGWMENYFLISKFLLSCSEYLKIGKTRRSIELEVRRF